MKHIKQLLECDNEVAERHELSHIFIVWVNPGQRCCADIYCAHNDSHWNSVCSTFLLDGSDIPAVLSDKKRVPFHFYVYASAAEKVEEGKKRCLLTWSHEFETSSLSCVQGGHQQQLVSKPGRLGQLQRWNILCKRRQPLLHVFRARPRSRSEAKEVWSAWCESCSYHRYFTHWSFKFVCP